MGTLDKQYFIKLDTKLSTSNVVPEFFISDNDTSDILIRITNENTLLDLTDVIVLMVAISPNSQPHSDFLEVKKAEEGLVYCDLPASFKNIEGTWKSRIMCIYQNDKVVTSTFSYNVNADEFALLNELALNDDRYPVLTEIISRLSIIEINENTRISNEANRVEAEKQREIIKQQLIDQVNKLISDTNLKIQTNLSEQNDKVTKLINDTEIKIDNYKTEKDLQIDQDLELYKNNKDIQINQNLEVYKTNTTANIEAYKNSKNAEINQYKNEKDLEIDNYVSTKNAELDNYIIAKNKELDNYKIAKDTLIDNKLKEVDTSEAARVQAENLRQQEHTARETFLNSFESRLVNTENTNNTQNTRLTNIETKNKVQDVYIQGLFNENNDKRLTVEGTGNNLTLTGSKKGLVNVDKLVGNTMVNLIDSDYFVISGTLSSFDNDKFKLVQEDTFEEAAFRTTIPLPSNSQLTIVYTVLENNLKNNNSLVIKGGHTKNIVESSLSIDASVGTHFITFTPNQSNSGEYVRFGISSAETNGSYVVINKNIFIMWQKPTNIPTTTFKGIKSSFEGQLVTQEMVTSGTEKVENLGKYKVNTKVRGKNLFNGKLKEGYHFNTNGELEVNPYRLAIDKISSFKGSSITISYDVGQYSFNLALLKYKDNDLVSRDIMFINTSVNTIGAHVTKSINVTDCDKIAIFIWNNDIVHVFNSSDVKNIQIEQNTIATSYEPYYERTQAVYLTSPLLKGDELIINEEGLHHYHKMNKVTLDGGSNIIFSLPGESYQSENIITIRYSPIKLQSESWSNSSKIICNTFDSKVGIDCAWLGKGEGVCSDKAYIMFSINRNKLITQDTQGFKTWLQANPTILVYELSEPYYEKISDYPITLESPNSATLSVESVIPCQLLKATYTGSVPSVYALENSVENIESQNVDIVATTWDVDYRLCEVEWVLEDAGITGINLINTFNLNMRGVSKMALTRYEQAKIMILGGAYEKETLTRQLTRYLEKGLVTQEEYDELIALMEARDLVTGE